MWCACKQASSVHVSSCQRSILVLTPCPSVVCIYLRVLLRPSPTFHSNSCTHHRCRWRTSKRWWNKRLQLWWQHRRGSRRHMRGATLTVTLLLVTPHQHTKTATAATMAAGLRCRRRLLLSRSSHAVAVVGVGAMSGWLAGTLNAIHKGTNKQQSQHCRWVDV